MLRVMTIMGVVAFAVSSCGGRNESTAGAGNSGAPPTQPSPAGAAGQSGQARAVEQLERCVRRWNSQSSDSPGSMFLSALGADALVRVSLSEREVSLPAGQAFLEAGNCIIAARAADGSGGFTFAENRNLNLDGSLEPGFGDVGQDPSFSKYSPLDTEANARVNPGGHLELLLSSGSSSSGAEVEPNEATRGEAAPTPARICESVRASDEELFGQVVVKVRVEKGRVSCAEARHVARTYFSGKAGLVSGASSATSYNTVGGGWRGSGRSESWGFDNARLKARIGGSFRYVCGSRSQSRPC